MGDCGCAKAKAELEEFLHRELSERDYVDVKAHLENCDDCGAEAKVGLTLMQKVRTACAESAPDALRERILAHIEAERA